MKSSGRRYNEDFKVRSVPKVYKKFFFLMPPITEATAVNLSLDNVARVSYHLRRTKVFIRLLLILMVGKLNWCYSLKMSKECCLFPPHIHQGQILSSHYTRICMSKVCVEHGLLFLRAAVSASLKSFPSSKFRNCFYHLKLKLWDLHFCCWASHSWPLSIPISLPPARINKADRSIIDCLIPCFFYKRRL